MNAGRLWGGVATAIINIVVGVAVLPALRRRPCRHPSRRPATIPDRPGFPGCADGLRCLAAIMAAAGALTGWKRAVQPGPALG